jgi:hypothetical protein
LLAALALTNARLALFQKVASMSSTLILALVVALALAPAPTMPSLKTKLSILNALKREKACFRRLFSIF